MRIIVVMVMVVAPMPRMRMIPLVIRLTLPKPIVILRGCQVAFAPYMSSVFAVLHSLSHWARQAGGLAAADIPLRPGKLATSVRGIALLCLALLVTLAGANLLYAALASRSEATIGAAGDLLFAAAFDGFLDDWSLYKGGQYAAIEADELELGVADAGTATWSTAQHTFGDFDMTLTASAIDGPIDNGFGIVFRLKDGRGDGCDLSAVILCGIADMLPLAGAAIRQSTGAGNAESYYAFLISSDGFYSLYHADGGDIRLRSAWIPSRHVRQGLGAANVIRVIGDGANFRFYINGAQVELCLPDDPNDKSAYYAGECLDGAMQAAFVDDSLATGALGVMAMSTTSGGGGVVARFDDVLVFQPGAHSEDARL